jgi:glycosyltransferase involved in cell wall biosynthesis
MAIGVCITTRHRPELLEECLQHLHSSTLRPSEIVVSDDSSDEAMITATKRVVGRFPGVTYARGPRRGVCANRNNALRQLGEPEYVAFLDDDALVTRDYLAIAQSTFDALPPHRRQRTITTGIRVNREGRLTGDKVRLNLRGFFVSSEKNEIAGASYSVYPRALFWDHLWDEEIYFGYEDADLSLRAIKDGYELLFVEQMVVTDGGWRQSTLHDGGKLDAYTFSGEAARLYVGVKRFGTIERDYGKLALFLGLYFGQVSRLLTRHQSMGRLPELVRLSHVSSLLSPVLQGGRPIWRR